MAHITQTATHVLLHFSIPKAGDLPNRITAAFVALYGPIPLTPEGEPAMTTAEFTWQKIRWLVGETLKRYEADRAIIAASHSISQAIDAETNTLD